MERLFGTSGIRGHIERINVQLSLDLGRALGTYLGSSSWIAVGIDARTSNVMLRNAFHAGVLSTGASIVDLGLVPMPVAAFSNETNNIDASVMITASHNPATDNGFKFFREGREFTRNEELEIERIIANRAFSAVKWDSIGEEKAFSVRESYLSTAKKFLASRGEHSKGEKVLLDAANGMASSYTPYLLRELGFDITTINSHLDGHFPGRPAEPSPRNLELTMKMMAEDDFSVGLCHDGDGDRLAVIDERGRFIDQNRIIALFARDEVRRNGGGRVVVSIDTSSVIDELVTMEGGHITRVPLGSLQEELAVDKNQSIVFASEPWKPIFTSFGDWMDGIVGAARLAQMISDEGNGSCETLMQSIPEYPMLRDFMQCPDGLKESFMKHVKGSLLDQLTGISKMLEVDGIRIDRDDGSYVLIRVSGTEPKARMYIGARTETTLNTLAEAARKAMATALELAESNNSSTIS